MQLFRTNLCLGGLQNVRDNLFYFFREHFCQTHGFKLLINYNQIHTGSMTPLQLHKTGNIPRVFLGHPVYLATMYLNETKQLSPWLGALSVEFLKF